jgi:predicted dehydrogenase
VLCEKPVAPTAADAQEMIDACRRNNVQFMDGVMFSHSKRLDALRARIDAPDGIGRLRRITSPVTPHFNGETSGSTASSNRQGAWETWVGTTFD